MERSQPPHRGPAALPNAIPPSCCGCLYRPVRSAGRGVDRHFCGQRQILHLVCRRIKQHYPALVYYGRWLREAARCLVSGAPIPTWDMSIGYGNDIVTTLSYYVMGDPLNLLAAFVPSQYGEQLLEFLMLLRVYLAGLAFMPFSLHHKNSRFGTLLGAVAYAFSAWTLQTALTEPFFIIRCTASRWCFWGRTISLRAAGPFCTSRPSRWRRCRTSCSFT